ncbi:LPXTG cell wall anchor domain-containing protein [Lacticaseibacillus daqingensis]|uniref:LPXTG cell wall anchor domain-containing protein n=1 Tax=Lacticaseibacillus daqingensis TaxID=2486014 RepID=UPI000F7854B9|nr:LPXTG cell wall anchor domain-containing protein [Lacticaseibacillus daqingensis]
MKDHTSTKKLKKTRRGWVTAALAASTLLSFQALNGHTVAAATATPALTQLSPDALNQPNGDQAGAGRPDFNHAGPITDANNLNNGGQTGAGRPDFNHAGPITDANNLNNGGQTGAGRPDFNHAGPITDAANLSNGDQAGAGRPGFNHAGPITDAANLNNGDQAGAGRPEFNHAGPITDAANLNNGDQAGAGRPDFNHAGPITDTANLNNGNPTGAGRPDFNHAGPITDAANQAGNATGHVQSEVEAYALGLRIGQTGAATLPASLLSGLTTEAQQAMRQGFGAGQQLWAQRHPQQVTPITDATAQATGDQTGHSEAERAAYALGLWIGQHGASALPDRALANQSEGEIAAMRAGFGAGEQAWMQRVGAQPNAPTPSPTPESVGPTDPTEPVESTKPTDPTEPAEATKPSAPTDSVEAATPTEPLVPGKTPTVEVTNVEGRQPSPQPNTPVATAAKPVIKVPVTLGSPRTQMTRQTAKRALPQTGGEQAVALSGLGLTTVIAALFGLAGDRRKRA